MEPIIREDLHLYAGRRNGRVHCDLIIAHSLEEAISKTLESDRLIAERCGIFRAPFLPDQTKPIEDYFDLILPQDSPNYRVIIRDCTNASTTSFKEEEYQIYSLANIFPGFCIARSHKEAWVNHFEKQAKIQNVSVSKWNVGLLATIGSYDFIIERMGAK